MFKIERMTDESNKKKRAVEGEIMDTTSCQVKYLHNCID
jgi:hypothetical protein